MVHINKQFKHTSNILALQNTSVVSSHWGLKEVVQITKLSCLNKPIMAVHSTDIQHCRKIKLDARYRFLIQNYLGVGVSGYSPVNDTDQGKYL